MPELPEVETTCRGIQPHLIDKTIQQVIVRQTQLRWPVPENLHETLQGQRIQAVFRHAKYIVLAVESGCVILHLGMSGNLRIIAADTAAAKHDHIDFVLSDGNALRLNDPRKFGAVLWTDQAINEHPLFKDLGPEPLSLQFDGSLLYQKSRNRKLAVKNFIMDSHIVVGVGNIYASEALFMAGIHPNRQAGKIAAKRYQTLADAIKTVLQQAINQGGTTLKDFVNAQGKPGYFQQSLAVYGRTGQPCLQCGQPIQQIKIAQRSSFFCKQCQK